MRVAYLASLYPALSHTFITNEILGVEAFGVKVLRFSVRQAKPTDILYDVAREEAAKTRWLVPPPTLAMVKAFVWALLTRPHRLLSVLLDAVVRPPDVKQKLKWLAYAGEGVLLAWWMVRDGAHHLHCHFGNSGSNAAAIAAKLAGIPFSITFHGIDLDEPEVFRHGDKLRDCAFSVCISDFGRAQLLRSGDETSPGKVHVVRCGYLAPGEGDLAPLPRVNEMVCVARLSEEKGHRVLLDALRILHERGRMFRCTLVGGGPLADEIGSQIARLELDDVVTMAGARAPAEIPGFVQQADLAVLASFREGIPMALIEAQSMCRPVVATSVGGIPELVRDGENGRLVRSGDPVALADAIDAMFADYDALQVMGNAGRRAVLANHDPDAAARRMCDLFQRSDAMAPGNK